MTELVFAVPGNMAAKTGGYSYDRHIVAELTRLGWSVRILPLSNGFPDPSADDLQAAAAAIASLPDDTLLLIDGLAFGAMPEIAKREATRVRWVAMIHHPLALEMSSDGDRTRYLREAERLALSQARAVITTSEATARQLAADYGVDRGRIAVAPPGTEPTPVATRTGATPVLLSVGSFIPRKGHDVLVTALSQLTHRLWTARFLGEATRDVTWARSIARLIHARGLANRILIEDSPDDETVAAAYLSADIFVLTSRHEGYGMAFAEALAAGLPIVGCCAGAVAELVGSEAGFLVPPNDVAAVSGALDCLLTDRLRGVRMAEAALRAGRGLPRWSDTGAIVEARLRQAMHG